MLGIKTPDGSTSGWFVEVTGLPSGQATVLTNRIDAHLKNTFEKLSKTLISILFFNFTFSFLS